MICKVHNVGAGACRVNKTTAHHGKEAGELTQVRAEGAFTLHKEK